MAEYTAEMTAGDLSTIFDASPFDSTDTESVLDGSWSCRMVVSVELGEGTPLIDRPVTDKTDDNRSFRCFISPTESTGLIGTYSWTIQIENLSISPPYRKETHIDLSVTKQGAV